MRGWHLSKALRGVEVSHVGICGNSIQAEGMASARSTPGIFEGSREASEVQASEQGRGGVEDRFGDASKIVKAWKS